MGKYSDQLLGGAQTQAPAPAPAQSQVKRKYSDMLLGGSDASLTSGTPESEAVLAKNRFEAMTKQQTIDEPGQGAAASTTLEASLSPDPKEQIQVFAKARGIPAERYGVDREGNIGFLNDKSQWVREVPTLGAGSIRKPLDLMQRGGAQLGFQARPIAAQTAGALAGGAVSAAGHPYLAVPAAGAAAGGVDILAQGAGEMLRGKDIGGAAQGVDYWNAAGQGALAAGAQGVTTAIDRLAYRNPLDVQRYEIDKLRTPQAQQAYADTEAFMQKQGISATPAEITDSRSLLQNQRQYGRFNETADDMANFYKNRAQNEVPDAYNRVAGAISPQTNPAQGARNFGEGASQTIEAAKDVRRSVADPLYAKARPQNIHEGTTLGLVDKADEIAGRYDMRTQNGRELRRIRNLFFATDDTGKIAIDESSGQPFLKVNVGDLHKIRREIDTSLGTAERAGNNELAGSLKELRSFFNKQMQGATPALRTADAAYAQYSGPVNELEQGSVGLAAADRATNFQGVPKILFDPGKSDPISVAKARQAYLTSGQEKAWNEGVRSYLDETFARVKKQDNYMGTLYRTLFGDKRQAAILKEALQPDQYAAFEDLFKAIDIARRALPEGSPTITDIGAKGRMVGPAAKMAARAAKGFSPQNIGQNVSELIEDVSASNNARRIVGIITRPGALQEIRKLRAFTGNQQKFLTAFDAVLANLGWGSVKPNTPEQVPAALGAR